MLIHSGCVYGTSANSAISLGQARIVALNGMLFNFRKSEERLAKVHQNEMDSQVAEHLRETQNMVHEFNRAQELLKDKVSALQLMYVDFILDFENY